MQPAEKRPFPTVELYEHVSTEDLDREIARVSARDRYQGKVDQLTEVEANNPADVVSRTGQSPKLE